MKAANKGIDAMAVTDDGAPPSADRKSNIPMVLGLVLASVLGAAGFFLAYTGMLPFIGGADRPASEPGPGAAAEAPGVPDFAYVTLPPMVVSVGAPGDSRHLRFQAELEVAPSGSSAVTAAMPRLLDALNGYLRAVPYEEFETPSALVKLRAQMLRRMQLVVGDGHVRDLLITEFVIN